MSFLTAVSNGEWCGNLHGNTNWIEFNFGSAVGIRSIILEKPKKGFVEQFSIQYVGLENVFQNYGQDRNNADNAMVRLFPIKYQPLQDPLLTPKRLLIYLSTNKEYKR